MDVDVLVPLEIQVPGQGPVTVVNSGNVAVYYKTNPAISASSHDGTLAAGATLKLVETTWFLASAGAAQIDYGSPHEPGEEGEPFGPALLGADGTVGGLGGSPLSSSVVTGSAIQWAAQPELLISGAITRDSNDAAIEAPVVWPDGDTGVYKATTVSSSFPGAVDAYTITKVKGGVTKTYTQSAVTRDANGAVTNRPPITVA